MLSLQQMIFTVVPALLITKTLSNKSPVIIGLGAIGGGVAGFVISNIVTDMKE